MATFTAKASYFSLLWSVDGGANCTGPRILAGRTGHSIGMPPTQLIANTCIKRHVGRLEVAALAKGGKPKKGKAPTKNDKLPKGEGKEAPPPRPPYSDSDVVMWSLTLIDSYFRATGKQLFSEPVELPTVAKKLWEAPFACMSHEENEGVYLFNYGNQAALDLFGRTWEEFLATPSAASAPGDNESQDGRNAVIAAGREKGHVDIAGAIRVNKSGRRFEVKDGTYWVVSTLDGEHLGEAAVIREWEFIDEEVLNESDALIKTMEDAPALNDVASVVT